MHVHELIYTMPCSGPMYCKYNAVLRDFPPSMVDGLKGNKYATTLHLIVSGVIKLSRCVVPSATPLLHATRVHECGCLRIACGYIFGA